MNARPEILTEPDGDLGLLEKGDVNFNDIGDLAAYNKWITDEIEEIDEKGKSITLKHADKYYYWNPDENIAKRAFMLPYRAVKKYLRAPIYGAEMDDVDTHRIKKTLRKNFLKRKTQTGWKPSKEGKKSDLKTDLAIWNSQFDQKPQKSIGQKIFDIARPVTKAIAWAYPAAKVASNLFEAYHVLNNSLPDWYKKNQHIKTGFFDKNDGSIKKYLALDNAAKTFQYQALNNNGANGQNRFGMPTQQLQQHANAFKVLAEEEKGRVAKTVLQKTLKQIKKIDKLTSGGSSSVGGGGGSSFKKFGKKRFSMYTRNNRYIAHKSGYVKHRKFKARRYYRKYFGRYRRKWSRRYFYS